MLAGDEILAAASLFRFVPVCRGTFHGQGAVTFPFLYFAPADPAVKEHKIANNSFPFDCTPALKNQTWERFLSSQSRPAETQSVSSWYPLGPQTGTWISLTRDLKIGLAGLPP